MSSFVNPITMNDVEKAINAARTFGDVASLFRQVFSINPPVDPDAYKASGSDYGLKARGVKTRERINARCREILARVVSPDALSAEDRAVLLQYSGRGGLTENSQYEYYTPTHVAQGVWDALRANGFANGNVLDPCCGAGVFSGTKPAGVVVTGNDLDPVGSKVASLLNPDDGISNLPFEQVVVDTPDDTFDACVGNVPFGNARGASMHIDAAYKNEKQIERYFLLRIIDKIKPGGLACLVVPPNIVGAKGRRWEEFRIALSRKAEFLGAHKLPSRTFSAQGTDTVVDVIVLRKHSQELRDKVEALTGEALRAARVIWDEFVEGRYWQGEGRPYIMGTYIPKKAGERFGRETVEGNVDDEGLKKKLAEKFRSRIDWDALLLAEPVVRTYAEGDRRVINGAMYELSGGIWQKVVERESVTAIDAGKFGAASVEELQSLLASPKGALALSADQAFATFKSYPTALSPLARGAVEFAMSQPRTELREQLYRGAVLGGMLARMAAKAEAGEDVTADRAELQELVVAEVERYGHPSHNKGLTLAGEGSRMFGMFKNAVDEHGRFSDLLAGTLDRSTGTPYNPGSVHDIVTYLTVREGREEVRLEDVQALYQGEPGVTSLGDIAEHEGVAVTPDGLLMPMNRYCAGDIYAKMAECAQAIAGADDERLKAKFRSQIDEMNRRRTVTRSEDIVFGLRNKWIPRKYVVDFLREAGYGQATYGIVKDVQRERYDGSIETAREFVQDYEAQDGEFRGFANSGFDRQFEKYLNGENITSSKADIKEEYLKQAASLESQFNVWLQQHPDIQELTDQFNRQFNAFVPVEYEGAPLGIDEYLSGEIVPHTYQNAEVRRLSEQGSGICGFGVGLGKSFTALAMAAYNKKLGRSRRACVVVPSAVLENWYHEARMFYNEAYLRSNVLFVGLEPKTDKDGVIQRREVLDENGKPKMGKNGQPVMQDIVVFRSSKEDIHEDMWKIPQSNFSLVVMTKEKFASIPLRPSTKAAYTSEMVARSLMSEKKAHEITSGKRSYADDKARANIEARYSDEGSRKKQELPYLEDMGFDSIIVDEAHYFKNSLEPGEHSQGIAYLPTAPAAQIAIDMSIKSHYLRSLNNGRGVYGLTATPVTNSPFEIFNMLSLVCPVSEFERFGVHTVDDFVRVFGKIETVEKLTVSNEIKSVPGLTGFQNLDGLRNLFHKYVNIRTVKDVDGEIHVPEADEQEESVPMNERQAALYEVLRLRAREAAKSGNKGGIFSIIRDMDRLATDVDMFDRTMTFVFPKKDVLAVRKLRESLPTEYTDVRTDADTQRKISFKVPVKTTLDESADDTVTLIVPEALEEHVVMRFRDCGISEDEVAHPITPKYAKMLENLRKHFEAGGKQLVFTEEKTQHRKIRRIIVRHLPITAEQIGIINADDASGDRLDKISKAYNAGAIRIVIANKKAEVGVNLQKGTTAIHHLTLPWTPASINQRNGRGVRQGNSVDSVAVYYYCVKGTFDSYRKDLLKAKSNWINDLLMGESTSLGNGDVTGMDELLDMLADNPEEARRMRAERLAAARAKKDAEFAQALINKLQVLASIQAGIDSADTRKEARRKTLLEQRAAAERAVARQQSALSAAESAEDKEESARRLAAAQLRKREAERKLEGLDEAFAAELAKLENNRRMTAGMLRQAERDGKLPFSSSLIDNPGNAAVSTSGQLFCVGDFFEFEGASGVYMVVEVRAAAREVDLVDILRDGGKRTLPLSKLPKGKKVSYAESELALKKLLSRQWKYADIRSSGIDRDTFLSHLDELDISPYYGAVYVSGGKYLVSFSAYGDPLPDDARYAWPDIDNEDFRKAVCEQYLEYVRRHPSPYSANEFLKALFGDNFGDIAAGYGHTGTESELLELAAGTWEDLQLGTTSLEARLDLCRLGTARQRITREIRERYDNDSRQVARLVGDYLQGIQDDLATRIREEREQAARIERERLRADPRFREVPAELAQKFREIGVEVSVNVREASFAGFRGRRGASYEPFARWFLKDATFGGPLYKMKDMLKSRYDAQFTKTWTEHGGAWWHIPSSTDLEELYNFLA